jgi:hypothetical protein
MYVGPTCWKEDVMVNLKKGKAIVERRLEK